MRARSLVAFTVLGQTAVGLFWAQAAVGWAVPEAEARMAGARVLAGVLMVGAGIAASLHLGTPGNAWRALRNLRTSWLSREVAAALLFTAGLVMAGGGRPLASPAVARGVDVLTALAGACLVYAMGRVYRLRAVPAWDTRLTTLSFFLTTSSTGTLLALAVLVLATPDDLPSWVFRALLAVGLLTLSVELGAEAAWRARQRVAHALVDAGLNPHLDIRGAAPWRAGLLAAGLVTGALTWIAEAGGAATGMTRVGVALAFGIVLVAAVTGRERFYAAYARRGL